jgi:aspartate kinase
MEQTDPSKKQTLVMKFGGTSVGNAEAMFQVAQIVKDAQEDWSDILIVTSAMAGVTNLLLETVHQAIAGQQEEVNQTVQQMMEKHLAILDPLPLPLMQKEQTALEINQLTEELRETCKAISILREASPRTWDAVASMGERLAVRILSAVLTSQNIRACSVDSTRLIITDDAFQNALPDFMATNDQCEKNLQPLLSKGYTPVITGFLGATPDGVITTLGRGGSDYSAAILSSAMNANEVWIWTDVDGVMSADPRLVANARTIPELTFREVAELAYYGAKVLHPKTIRPIIESEIGLRVCNTFNPQHPGTRLVSSRIIKKGGIKAVTAIRDVDLLSIEGRGMLGVPGVAARTFSAVAETGTSVPMITQSSSEQTITFAVPQHSSAKVIAALEKAFANEIQRRDIDSVSKTGSAAIVTIVGAGMAHTAGISGKIFSALGNAGVNVIAIAQGSSEVSISLVVCEQDLQKAVHAIHALIVND